MLNGTCRVGRMFSGLSGTLTLMACMLLLSCSILLPVLSHANSTGSTHTVHADRLMQNAMHYADQQDVHIVKVTSQGYLEVASYAALRALSSSQLSNGDLIYVSGQAQPFMFSKTVVSADNAVVFAMTDNGGVAVRLFEDAVHLSWYDGSMSSSVMTNLLSLYSKVIVDASFTASSQITLSDGNILEWAPGARISWTYGDSLLLGADDIKLLSPVATGPGTRYFLECQYGDQNIVIRDAVITDANLIRTNNPSGGYSAATLAGLTKNIVIDNALGLRSSDGDTNAFINLRYVDGVRVNGGSARRYWFGVQYWGGDSDPSDDGVRENERFARNIVVNGFNADGTIHAGLWGSMGNCIRFINCTARRDSIGGDVGIDHEGSWDVKNIGCTSENWNNGNYACFWRYEDVSFVDCNSYQVGGRPHFKNYNSSGNYIHSGDVSIIGGYMTTTDIATSGEPASINNSSGAARSFTIKGTRLLNSIVNIGTNNQGAVSVDVDARWTIAPTDPQVTCYVKTNVSARLNYQVTARVLVDSSVTMPTGSYAVMCATSAYNQSHMIRISECKDGGLGICVQELGTNSGISGKFLVYDNIVSSLTKLDDGAKALVILRQDNNYDEYGNAVSF